MPSLLNKIVPAFPKISLPCNLILTCPSHAYPPHYMLILTFIMSMSLRGFIALPSIHFLVSNKFIFFN